MSTFAIDVREDFQPQNAHTMLELTVRNHPGVMSHICGLFARRAFNVEGILCVPIGDGELSRIRLFVNENQRLDQVIKQVVKLEDVLELRRCGADQEIFMRMESLFREAPGDALWRKSPGSPAGGDVFQRTNLTPFREF